VPEPHATPVTHQTIRLVAASLRRGLKGRKRHGPRRTLAFTQFPAPDKTYARFLVRATTGQRPAQIMRAEPGDVDLKRKLWFVRPVKGGTMIPLPLNREMVDAWKAFIKAKAWGSFDVVSFAKLLRRHGWPKGVRPYNLRHTFAIDHLLQGTSLGDVQGLLGHKDISTTRQVYGPIQLALLQKAVGRRRLNLPSAV
jgi:integrase